MALTYVRYEAEGWGVGELVLDAERVLHSDLPRPSARGADAPHPLAERLRAYFSGQPVEFADVPVRLHDDLPLTLALAEQLRRVPRGEVVTYGELALLAGRPRAARAAGTFCAHCALAPIVPVHRVVSANGIGGFGSLGTEYKRRLLELEGVAL